MTGDSAVLIDGSQGEGGGQVVRTSVALAAVTGRPIEVVGVRAKRERPGLQPQHLAAVRAAAAICDAHLDGDAIGSSRLRFSPRDTVRAGQYHFDITTAGSVTLVAQTVVVPLALASEPSRVTILGGTHNPMSPPAEYLEEVYTAALGRLGFRARAAHSASGFYPRGGGRIEVEITGTASPRAATYLERSPVERIDAYVVTSRLPPHVFDRGARTVERALEALGLPVNVVRRDEVAPSPGAAVVLVARCVGCEAGFSAIGRPGRPMEHVAQEACDELAAWWNTGAPCDEHLVDQLVLPASLATSESRWRTSRITEHLRTVLRLVERFLPVETSLDESAGTVLVRRADR